MSYTIVNKFDEECYLVIDDTGDTVGVFSDIPHLVFILGVLNSWDNSLIQYYKNKELVYSLPVKNFVATKLLPYLNYETKPT